MMGRGFYVNAHTKRCDNNAHILINISQRNILNDGEGGCPKRCDNNAHILINISQRNILNDGEGDVLSGVTIMHTF